MRMLLRRDLVRIAILLALAFLTTHCGTTKKITGKITSDVLGRGTPLKKKIAFLPALNHSSFGGEDFGKAAARQLRAHIRRHCDGLHLSGSPEIRQALGTIPRLPSDHIDNFALANLGRIYGLQAVVQESIMDVDLVIEKHGIWGFRRKSMLLRASVCVKVYDVETTAILLNGLVEETLEISAAEWQDIKEGNVYNRELANALLAKITPRAADIICDGLAEEPWKGYITAGAENIFTISAGTDVGLAPENILEVFGMDEPIEGQGNRVYLVPGPKIGEIKLTNVQENEAEAIGLSGQDLEKSSRVMLKP